MFLGGFEGELVSGFSVMTPESKMLPTEPGAPDVLGESPDCEPGTARDTFRSGASAETVLVPASFAASPEAGGLVVVFEEILGPPVFVPMIFGEFAAAELVVWAPGSGGREGRAGMTRRLAGFPRTRARVN